ncbi:MAG TPA: hypothetical protein VFE47_14605 [Tepidisphaeraceae bacterium]|nr:hypothetical protein [Tepidisphaeraceae bacterium]
MTDFSATASQTIETTDHLPGQTLPAYPYPGLRPFRTEEAQIFFGRDSHIDQLLEKLTNNRFVAVIGASGCGKSSLVRAGLIPLLKSGFVDTAGSHWRIAQMRPGEQPFARLADGLCKGGFGRDGISDSHMPAILEATLRRGPFGLADVLEESRPPAGTNLLVVVDQFEELFRYRSAGSVDDAEAFVNLLLGSLKSDLPIYVVITMRSDFLSDCVFFGGLPEAMNGSQFLTPRLNRDQISEAIIGPARLCQGDLEPELVNRLINDMADDPDRLPLLQHVLMRMWTQVLAERAAGGSDPGQRVFLSLAHYEAVGGFDHSLSDHADSVFNGLGDGQKLIAERLFRCLCEHGADNRNIRRPARVTEVAAVAGVSAAQVIEVAGKFCSNETSFIAAPQEGLSPDSVLDITHESLMTHWRKLADWVSQETWSGRRYTKLLEQALDWEQGQIEKLRGVALDRALEWESTEKPSAAWATRYGGEFEKVRNFLRQSEAARSAERQEKEVTARRELEHAAQARFDRERAEAHARGERRLRTVLVVIGILLAVMVAIAVYAIRQDANAHTGWQIAKEQMQLVAKNKVTSDYQSSYAEAISKIPAYDYDGARLLLANQTLPPDLTAEQLHSRELFRQLLDAASEQPAELLDSRFNPPVHRVVASPDGNWLLAISDSQAPGAASAAQVYDVHHGKLMALPTGDDGVTVAAFDQGGKWLFTGGKKKVSRWSLPPVKSQEVLAVENPTASLAVSPNGAIAIGLKKTSGSSGRVYLVTDATNPNITTWNSLPIDSLHAKGKPVITFDADGTHLYMADPNTAGAELDLIQYDIATTHTEDYRDALLKLRIPDARISQIGATAHLGGMFAIALENGQIYVIPWQLLKTAHEPSPPGNGAAPAAANSESAQQLWNPERKGFCFLQNGELLAYPSWNRMIAVTQSESGVMLKVGQGYAGSLASVSASKDALWSCSTDGRVYRWAYGTALRKASLNIVSLGTDSEAVAAAIKPDGSAVAVGFADGAVRLYDLPLGNTSASKQIGNLSAKITHLCFDSTGKRLAVSTADDQIAVRDSDGPLTPISWERDPKTAVRSIDFSPKDPGVLAFATSEGKFGILDAKADGWKRRFPDVVAGNRRANAEQSADDAGMFSIRFNRDGKQLVTCGGKIGVQTWGADSGNCLKQPDGNQAQHYALFSPVDGIVASAGRDSVIHMGAKPDLFNSARDLNQIEFGREDSQLFAVGGDGKLHIFDLALNREVFSMYVANFAEAGRGIIPDLSVRCPGNDIWIAIPFKSRLAVVYLPGVYGK